jgi:hypothetical protein
MQVLYEMHTRFVTKQNLYSKIDQPINNLKSDGYVIQTLGSNHDSIIFEMGILSQGFGLEIGRNYK